MLLKDEELLALGSWEVPIELCEKLFRLAVVLAKDNGSNPFYDFVSTYRASSDPYECTIVKSAVKRVMHDEDISQAVLDLAGALEKANIKGEIHGKHESNQPSHTDDRRQ